MSRAASIITALLFGLAFELNAGARERQTESIFLITLDGVRWQEVFSGADERLLGSKGVADTNQLAKAFWRETPEARREALFPFLWQKLAKNGRLWGNQRLGSFARVTNGKNFTYPGFNEILTGFADDSIKENAKIANRNVSVFEWLNGHAAFRGRVAAFANWDVFPYILNASRANIPIWTGYDSDTLEDVNDRMKQVRAMAKGITPVWDGMNFDIFFHHASLEYVLAKKPRLVWIAYSETDEWAHEGRYDLYLHAAHRIDSYVRELWSTIESLPEYRGKTTIILTTDHGRGGNPSDWQGHGADVKGSEFIWVAMLGPDTKVGGETRNVTIGQNQIAATIALLLGENYKGAAPNAGDALDFQ